MERHYEALLTEVRTELAAAAKTAGAAEAGELLAAREGWGDAAAELEALRNRREILVEATKRCVAGDSNSRYHPGCFV